MIGKFPDDCQKFSPRSNTLCASDYLKRLLAEVALVRVQGPIQLSQYSEPEPDIAVVQIDVQKYIDHHPAPNEIFLLIGVADTTIDTERKKKRLYMLKQELLTTGFWM